MAGTLRGSRWRLVLVAAIGLAGASVAMSRADADPGRTFVPQVPARLLDTRPGGQTVDGRYQGGGLLAAEQVVELVVGGRSGVPHGPAAPHAAALTFTVTNPKGPGFLTVWPCGGPRPNASLSNFSTGETIAATTMAAFSFVDSVCVASSVATHLIVDVAGHEPNRADFAGTIPTRIADTRSANATFDGLQSGAGPVAAGSTTRVAVGGRGIVAVDASSVYVTVTMIGLAAPGFATAHRCDLPRPDVSTVNVPANRAAANTTVVSMLGGPDICVFSSAPAQLIVDVVGFEQGTSALDPTVTRRALDTRGGIPLGPVGRKISLGVNGPKTPFGIGSAVLNATAVLASGAGFVTIYPVAAGGSCEQGPPNASVLNFAKGQTIANLVFSGVGTDSAGYNAFVCAYSSVPTDFLLDVVAITPSDSALTNAMMLSVAPIGDAFTDASSAAVNHGSETSLIVDADPHRESLLAFDVRSRLGQTAPGIATLRLHVEAVSAAVPDPGSTSGGSVQLLTGAPWTETDVTNDTRPIGTRTAQATIGAVAADQWIEVDVTAAVWKSFHFGSPTVDLVLTSSDTNGAYYSSRESAFAPELLLSAADTYAGPVVAAVGDIACAVSAIPVGGSCSHVAVADRIAADPSITSLLTLGDLQYQTGSASDFAGSYGPAFGRFSNIVHPVPGNHEYGTANAAGYFGYFGAAAADPAKGYYTFVSGGWRFIALNTNLSCATISCAPGSAQEQFLRSTMAADQEAGRACTIVYWHHPRFSSDTSHGDNTDVQPLWAAAANGGADLVLNGHVHTYERFDPILADGQLSPDGARQIIVGTGGIGHYANGTPKTGSVARITDRFGYLRIATFPASYRWEFVTTTGRILDSGSGTCRR